MEARSKLSLDTYYISNSQTLVQRVSFSQRGPIRYIVCFHLSLKCSITNGFVHHQLSNGLWKKMAFDVCVSTRNLKTRAQLMCSGQILIYWFCYYMGVLFIVSFILSLQTLKLSMWPRERENAGLNLTCASRVFLLESVVQHSFEIQGTCGCVEQVYSWKLNLCSTAIARIDRLGQTRPTEGQEKSDLDTTTTYFHYFRNSILLLRWRLACFHFLQSTFLSHHRYYWTQYSWPCRPKGVIPLYEGKLFWQFKPVFLLQGQRNSHRQSWEKENIAKRWFHSQGWWHACHSLPSHVRGDWIPCSSYRHHGSWCRDDWIWCSSS